MGHKLTTILHKVLRARMSPFHRLGDVYFMGVLHLTDHGLPKDS